MDDALDALDALLAELRVGLGDELVGCYALAAPASFLVVTSRRLRGAAEDAVREVHRSLPADGGGLAGGYAPAADLRSPMTVGRGWLRVESGSRELLVSPVGNTVHDRWLLLHRARVLHGPGPAALVHEIDVEALRAEALGIARARAEHVEDHPGLLADPASRRELVGAMCQVLHTAHHGSVLLPEEATAWARREVPAAYVELVTAPDRADGPRVRAFTWEVHRLVGALVVRPG